MEQLQVIQSKIYEVRGYKVILDFDLASLYGTETKRLKEAVKRNLKRFPPDFMFELTKEELVCLRTHFASSNKRGGIRYMPFAFTEQGVAMLSSVLNSDIAIEINIHIMRAFVAIRKMLTVSPIENKVAVLEREVREIKAYMEDVFTDYNDINEDTRMQLELINRTLAELQTEKKPGKPRNPVGFIKPGNKEQDKNPA